SDHPMVPLAFFGDRRFSAAIASLALVLFALMGMFFLMTQYLQFSLGFSPLQAGIRVAPIAFVLLVSAPMSVLLARWHALGTKPVVTTGLLLCALGLGMLSRTSVHSTYGDLLPAFVVIGIGVGFTLTPSTESVMGSLPAAEAGVGSATNDTALQIGGAVGVGVLGTVLNGHYRLQMRSHLAGLPIPEGIRHVILGSLSGAQAVAARVPGPSGRALSSAAQTSFVSGMDQALLIAAVVVGVAGVVVLGALPNRGATPAPGADESRGLTAPRPGDAWKRGRADRTEEPTPRSTNDCKRQYTSNS
ncbi:MAG: MFS transporter, partial [Nitrososphaerales archaeon]